MNTIEQLEKLFREFPGIGPRQAKRFVYFLLTKNPEYTNELVRYIKTLKQETIICTSCFRYVPKKDHTEKSICMICADTSRDQSLLMVVSRDVDFENIEKTKTYMGYYFILGGSVPILEQEPQKKIRIRELHDFVSKNTKLKEIVLALNANAEGENTADYIRVYLKEAISSRSITISTLGRGLATGAELEYADTETLKNALKNRQ